MSELVPLVRVAAARSTARRDGRIGAVGRTYGLESGSTVRVRVGTPPA